MSRPRSGQPTGEPARGARGEKGGGTFAGIKLLLCENPLPPIEEAIAAAQAEVPHGNYYTEAYSQPLRHLIGERLGVPERLIHINAGSELILRQVFDRVGQQVHLLTPTYPLFPSETYFFLADFAPHDAAWLAEALRAHNILIKPLHDERLGPGYMRVTTALPADNARFVEVLASLLR